MDFWKAGEDMNDEALRFKKKCEIENSILATIIDKEIVSEEIAFESLVIVKNMKIAGVGDALLFASALNALNTYVKQSKENKEAVGYSFKKNVDILIKYIIKNPNELLQAEIQKDRDMSICYVVIGGIQFSFHNVDLNENNKKIAVDDNNRTIVWDGIKKQNCAKTVFDFAMNNDYDRANKMMDDSDFIVGMDSLVAEYRAGTKSIADVKRVIYGKKNDDTASKKVDTSTEQDYPFRNQAASTLYVSDAKSVLEEIENRSLVPYLIKTYESGYGFNLPVMTEIEWKYAFETLAALFNKVQINPDAGIKIDCCRMMNQEFLVIGIASKDQDNRNSFTAITMLTWEKMKLDEDGMVIYSDYDHSLNIKSIHPSKMTAQYMMIMSKGLISLEIGSSKDSMGEVKACTYFYDAPNNADTDIVTKYDEKILSRIPAFYANETDALCDYIKYATDGNKGRDALRDIKDLTSKYGLDRRDDISNEERYVVCELQYSVAAGLKGLIIINIRKALNNDDFLHYMTNELDANQISYSICRSDMDYLSGKEDVVIYYDYIPDMVNALSGPVSVLIVDEYGLSVDEKGDINELKEQIVFDGGSFSEYKITRASGYVDKGAGNNWLIRNLTLGNAKFQEWAPKYYPITVVDSVEEFTSDEGIGHIVLSDSFRYDEKAKCVIATDEERTRVYKSSTEGINGIQIYIPDKALKEYIAERISNITEEMAWMGSFINSNGSNAETLTENIKENRNNTNLYNMYKGLAMEYLGLSAWNKMAEDSQDWLVSAMLSYNDMKNTDPLMDFSGVTLMVSKTFENELTARWGTMYEEYMQKKYGDKVIDKLPEALVDTDKYGERKIMPVNKLTLGSIPFIMGLDAKGRMKNEEEYKEFKAFGKDELLINIDEMDDVIQQIVEIVYYVRVNFRNKSAHKDVIDIVVATDCMEYCVTDKCKLGYLMDQLKK